MAAFGRFCLIIILGVIAISLLHFAFAWGGYAPVFGSASYWFGFLACFVCSVINRAVSE